MTEENTGEGLEPVVRRTSERSNISTVLYILVLITLGLTLFNQYQISVMIGTIVYDSNGNNGSPQGGIVDLSSIDLASLKSTAHTIAAVFPIDQMTDSQSVINIVIPTGTPEYGPSLGVSYDDPVGSLSVLANLYPAIKAEVQSDSALWSRYLNLATRPLGISCEFCCRVGPVSVTSDGTIKCGCQHAPALHALTLWLMKNTDYTDGEVLLEVMRWKALFFPKAMVNLATQVAGSGGSLDALPGMVGGC